MFFTKSDAAIGPAVGVVRRPPHVTLLDYEIELALVFRRSISSPITVTPKTLKDYIFAATIANDIRARDVQLPQMQFFKGKSYRNFCPRAMANDPQAGRVCAARQSRSEAFGQWHPSAGRHDGQSCLQAFGDDFGTINIRQHRAGRCAPHRYAERLRVAGSTADGPASPSTVAGA
jgi:hypothetical protein